MIHLRNSLWIVLALFFCANAAWANPISAVSFASSSNYTDGGTALGATTVSITGTLEPNVPPSEAIYTVSFAKTPANDDDYLFTVNLTNNTSATVDQIQFELLSLPVGSVIHFEGSPAPTNNWGATSTLTSTTLVYTGTLADGAPAAQMTFTVNVKNPGGAGSFSFKLTATPEPTSLIFGAIGMSLAGGAGFYARRRRQKEKTEWKA